MTLTFPPVAQVCVPWCQWQWAAHAQYASKHFSVASETMKHLVFSAKPGKNGPQQNHVQSHKPQTVFLCKALHSWSRAFLRKIAKICSRVTKKMKTWQHDAQFQICNHRIRSVIRRICIRNSPFVEWLFFLLPGLSGKGWLVGVHLESQGPAQ